MDELLLNAHSKQQLLRFIEQPSQTVALIGTSGSGKRSIALQLASKLLDLPTNKLESYPYLKIYAPENNAISIEAAREITTFTKLKTTGTRSVRRVVVIEDAQTLSREAQNALLKTLEEPPADTVFILTITNTAAILPTILSRVQIIPVRPIDQTAHVDFFTKAGHEPRIVTQYFYMSNGLPGLTHALLTNDENHPLTVSIKQAKDILQADSFERLVKIDDIVKQKQTEKIINALSTISRTALYVEAGRTNTQDAALKRWTHVLEMTEKAKENIQKNAQAKLVLTSLFLEI